VADISQVDILRQGPREWNEWRERNPSQRPHLAHLSLALNERQWGAVHGGPINLKSAVLPDASLRFASLLDADLQAADLTRADLVHARLNRANLKDAILKDAVLDHADFANAEFGRAVLTGASLKHARNLTQSQIEETIGDSSTSLPDDLEMPAGWLDRAAPDYTRSGQSSVLPQIMVAAAMVCVIGAVWYAGTTDEPAAVTNDRTEAISPGKLQAPRPTAQNSAAQLDAAEKPNRSSVLAEHGEPAPAGSQDLSAATANITATGEIAGSRHSEFATAEIERRSEIAVQLSAGTGSPRSTVTASAIAALGEKPPVVATVATPIAELAPPLPLSKLALADTSPTADLANSSVNSPAPVAELAPPLPLRKPALADASPTPDLANSSVKNPVIDRAMPKVESKKTASRPAKVAAQPSNVGQGSSAAEVLAGGL
jgi:uncharacterized protein YjbI with pentapeptide repeats